MRAAAQCGVDGRACVAVVQCGMGGVAMMQCGGVVSQHGGGGATACGVAARMRGRGVRQMQLVAQRGGADVRASVACACENQGVRERARAEAGAEAAAWRAWRRRGECRRMPCDARAMHVPM